MMIDIDHFKLFNDRYGHVRGDACLRAVGETLSLVALDDAVVVARYGGEEFALLLPGLDIGRTTALAEEARRAIEDLLITHADALAVSSPSASASSRWCRTESNRGRSGRGRGPGALRRQAARPQRRGYAFAVAAERGS